MSRTARAILSTSNLLHNLQVIKSRLPQSKIIAMIKANAYGHGIRSVGQRLDGKADVLGVASIDEALILRKVGVKSPIMLMQGLFEESEMACAAEEGFHVVFNNPLQIKWLEHHINFSKPLEVWLKVNTGMSRLGFDLDQAQSVYQKLSTNKNIAQPVGIMSHFACSENIDHPLNAQQIHNFLEFSKDKSPRRSLCNSGAIFNFPQYAFEYARPGIALYGASPIPGTIASDYNLKPVMTLQSTLTAIQNLKKGSFVGYGGRFVCPENMPVGIVTLGYGDGYPVSARDGAPVLVGGKICSLVGRVSMDMLAVDLRSFADAKVGDVVTLWGQGLPIETLSDYTSDISWSLLTGMQHRVKFIWTD